MSTLRRTTAFSATYRDARHKLLAMQSALGYEHAAYVAPGIGAQHEALAVDVLRVGDASSRRALLLTSGCHGVEGFAGSAVQLALLCDEPLMRWLVAQRIALVVVHALNPYGFSWCRRVTHENVDLNRNAVNFFAPLPQNCDYRELHPYLLPRLWPPSADNERMLERFIERWGMRRFQQVLTRGQYDHADGLFFGGTEPTWSLRTFQAILLSWVRTHERVAWIDLHTGLGPPGTGEPIFTGGGRSDALALAKRWWGERVTCTADGSSVSADLNGTLPSTALAALGDKLVTSMTLEFGTVSALDVLAALRIDAAAYQFASHHTEPLRVRAMQAMRDAFFVDTDDWRNAVTTQSMSMIRAALDGLARDVR